MDLPNLESTFETLVDAFVFLDINKDGYVSKSEMVQAINETTSGEGSSGRIALKRFGEISPSLSPPLSSHSENVAFMCCVKQRCQKQKTECFPVYAWITELDIFGIVASINDLSETVTGCLNINNAPWFCIAEEMDWDKNGMVNFKEFLFAFTRWVGIEDMEEEDDESNA